MKPGRNKTEVTTGLGRNPNAVTGALISNGILYAAIIPRRRDGTVETGAADAQSAYPTAYGAPRRGLWDNRGYAQPFCSLKITAMPSPLTF